MFNKRQKSLVIFLFTLVISGLAVYLLPSHASAAVSATVLDRAHIKIGDRLFVDSDIDDNFNYKEQSPTDRCEDYIFGFDNDDLKGTNTPDSAKIKIRTPKPNNDRDCNETEDTVNFSSAPNFLKSFLWVDENTIIGADGKITFQRDGSTNTFKDANSEDRCIDTLVISGNNQTATLQEREFEKNGNHEYDWYPFTITDRKQDSASGCWESDPVSNVKLAGNPTDGNEAGETGSLSGSAFNGRETCESAGGLLGWIMCPVINLLDGFFNWVDSRIQELLSIDEEKYRDPSLKLTWSTIRNLAYSILIPIMLVMVLSTALGFEFVSAYTFKKAMPRFIVAVIFIALSWEITGFLIGLSNDFGHGVLGLITSPLALAGGSDGVTLQDLFTPSYGGAVTQVAAGTGVVLGLVLAALNPASLAAIGLFLLSGVGALLVAFITLVARQLFILAFMISMPLAILAWIFPGNDKIWKIAWGSFTKLLIMFPLITALIGVGRVFAYIIGNANSSGADGAVLNPILKLVAYIIPYVFIPATFKFAGGVFAQLSGMANDKSRGMFDRLRNARKSQYGKVTEDIKKGNYVRGINPNSNTRRGRLNKLAQTAAVIPKSGLGVRDALNKDRRQDILGKARGAALAEAEHEAQKDQLMNSFDNDDMAEAAQKIALGKMTEEEARAFLIEKNPYLYAGEHNKGRLDAAMNTIRVMRKRHGSGVIAEAAFKRRAPSSTAWTDDARTKLNPDGSRRHWTASDMTGVETINGIQTRFGVDEHGRHHYEGELMYEYDEDGEKIYDEDKGQAAGKMLKEALEVSHGNFELATSLAMHARSQQDRVANRHDIGGGGASETIIALEKLANNQTDIEGATEIVTDSMAKGKPVDEAAAGGKSSSARGAFRAYKRVSQKAANSASRKYNAAVDTILLGDTASRAKLQNLQQAEASGQVTPEEALQRRDELLQQMTDRMTPAQQALVEQAKEKHRQEYIRIQAQEQLTHAAFARTSPDAVKISGQFFSEKVDLKTLPEKLRLQLIKRVRAVPNPAFNPSLPTSTSNPATIPETYYDQNIDTMTRNEINDALRDDETWRAFVKEYGLSQAQAEQARAAAAASGANAAEIEAQTRGGEEGR